MIFRVIDPSKLKVESDCFEVSEVYVGERVEGVEIRGFELVKPEEDFESGFEIVGELNDRLGIVVLAHVDSDVAFSLEPLIAEVMNRIKGLRYDFRKDRVVITVSPTLLSQNFLECIGKLLHSAFASIGMSVRVRLIADRDEFDTWLKIARQEYAKRRYEKDEDEVDVFYACKSCQYTLPGHMCIITPDRPSPCGTRYIEARAAEKLGIVGYYSTVSKGKKVGSDEYEGVNEALKKESEGKIERGRIHSVIDAPLPSGLYSEIIVFYIPEKDGFGIVDRDYKGKTPIGLTFREMERMIVGKQVSGFVGESFEYLKSKKFLSGEGGWKKVVWVSDAVREFIRKHNLPADID